MSDFEPMEGERRILEEDCAEDKMGSGILILTNKRIAFRKTEGRMATFTKKEGRVIIEMPIEKISLVKSEGFLVKKIVIASIEGNAYKFGVFNNGKWEKEIKKQMHERTEAR